MEILTILDDPREVEKGRQKELNSLKEVGAMAAVKRVEAAGKRVIQTPCVNRENDGRVKSRLVLYSDEMFAPTPSTVSLKTMFAVSSHDRNNQPERDYLKFND